MYLFISSLSLSSSSSFPNLAFVGKDSRVATVLTDLWTILRTAVVEANNIVIRRGNGTCARNGYAINADHTIERGNRCSIGDGTASHDEEGP